MTTYSPKYGHKIEHSIVRLLVGMLAKEGWKPSQVDDGGDELVKVSNIREVLDAVFAVDDARLYFTKNKTSHGVLLIGGNMGDIISDWSFTQDDPDGFNKAMDAVLDVLDKRGL